MALIFHFYLFAEIRNFFSFVHFLLFNPATTPPRGPWESKSWVHPFLFGFFLSSSSGVVEGHWRSIFTAVNFTNCMYQTGCINFTNAFMQKFVN